MHRVLPQPTAIAKSRFAERCHFKPKTDDIVFPMFRTKPFNDGFRWDSSKLTGPGVGPPKQSIWRPQPGWGEAMVWEVEVGGASQAGMWDGIGGHWMWQGREELRTAARFQPTEVRFVELIFISPKSGNSGSGNHVDKDGCPKDGCPVS